MHINVWKIQIITENHVNATQSGESRQVDGETVTVEEFASEEYVTIIDSYEIVAVVIIYVRVVSNTYLIYNICVYYF